MTGAQILWENPSCCSAAHTSLRAVEPMKGEDIGSVPVVASNSDRRVIGIVTGRDLTLRLIAEGRAPKAPRKTMSRHQIRRIPIADEQGRLCGIVAQADLARHLDEREAGEVLGDMSQPGHSAIGSALPKVCARVRRSNTKAYGANWFAGARIGAALGAGF